MGSSTTFLLSPAYCGGRRATYLLRPASALPLAQRLASGRLTLGEAFAFMSGLYFRGKLTYATRFAPGDVFVITPTRGLLTPDARVTPDLLREFAAVDVCPEDQRYRRPLERSIQAMIRRRPSETRYVLLGSIATGKYVDVLTRLLASRLHFPSEFVGRGDMSRGGLLLRQAESGIELDYVPFGAAVVRHGPRPPKLPPLRR